jgi:hypothetical protein
VGLSVGVATISGVVIVKSGVGPGDSAGVAARALAAGTFSDRTVSAALEQLTSSQDAKLITTKSADRLRLSFMLD